MREEGKDDVEEDEEGGGEKALEQLVGIYSRQVHGSILTKQNLPNAIAGHRARHIAKRTCYR